MLTANLVRWLAAPAQALLHCYWAILCPVALTLGSTAVLGLPGTHSRTESLELHFWMLSFSG